MNDKKARLLLKTCFNYSSFNSMNRLVSSHFVYQSWLNFAEVRMLGLFLKSFILVLLVICCCKFFFFYVFMFCWGRYLSIGPKYLFNLDFHCLAKRISYCSSCFWFLWSKYNVVFVAIYFSFLFIYFILKDA